MSSTLVRCNVVFVALIIFPWQSGCNSSPEQAENATAEKQSSNDAASPAADPNADGSDSQPGDRGREAQGPSASSSAPRTEAEILNEERNLPTLYLIPGTLREVVVAGSNSAAVDPETGSLAFRALVCRNPDCPALKSAGEPVRFIWTDPLKFAKPDGTIGYKEVNERAAETVRLGGTLEPQCPACLKIRNIESETPEVQQQYLAYCEEYILPETKRRMEELGQEQFQLIQAKQKRKAANRK